MVMNRALLLTLCVCISSSCTPDLLRVGPNENYTSLDSALLAAQSLNLSTVIVDLAYQANLTLSPILWNVCVNTSGSQLTIANPVLIGQSGDVVFSGFQIYTEVIQVEGKLTLINCRFDNLKSSLAVIVGSIVIQGCEFRGGNATLLYSSQRGIGIDISDTSYVNNSASLLILDLSTQSLTPTQIILNNATLQGNSVASLIVFRSTSDSLLSSSFLVYNSTFNSNSALLFSFTASDFHITIEKSGFSQNSGGSILLDQSRTQVTVTQCQWIDNSGIQVEVLSGSVSLMNTLFAGQRDAGPLLAKGTGEYCSVNIEQVTFRDYNTSTQLFSAGVLYSANCDITVSQVSVANVSMSGQYNLYKGFFVFQGSSVAMDSVETVESRSSQALIYSVMSTFYLNNVTIDQVGVGFNILIVLSLNVHVAISNANISNIVALSTSDSVSVSIENLAYILHNSGNHMLSNITITGTSEQCSVGFVVNLANKLIARNIKMSNLIFKNGAISLLESNAELEEFEAIGIQGYAMFAPSINTKFSILKAVIKKSQLNYLQTSEKGIVTEVKYITLMWVTTEALWFVHSSRMLLSDLYISDCNSSSIIVGYSNSVITIKDTVIERVNSAFFLGVNSSLSCSNTTFTEVQSQKGFIDLTTATCLLSVVNMQYFSMKAHLAAIRENAQLQINNSSLLHLTSTVSSAIQISGSQFTLDGCQIAHCPLLLIDGNMANISIFNTEYQDGGPSNQSILSTGGLLACTDCEFVSVVNSTSWDVQSYTGGAIYCASTGTPSYLQIENSNFINCSANTGGAIQVFKVRLSITNSNFTLCSASESGGAIWTLLESSLSLIANSQFTWNSAPMGSGIVFNHDIARLINVAFSDNTADYGQNIASYGVNIQFHPNTDTNFTLVSGTRLPFNLVFQLIDHFGQVVNNNNQAQISIVNSKSVHYGGIDNLLANRGVFNLSNSPFYVQPGTEEVVTARIQTTRISLTSTQKRTQLENLESNFSFTLSFRNCTPGELYSLDRCSACSTGTYSFNPSDNNCSECPANVFCPGGNVLILNPGYWRASENTSHVNHCQFHDNCLGSLTSECAEGYSGELCMRCSPDWYRVGTLYCQQCSTWSTALQLSAFAIQIISVMGAVYYFSFVRFSNAAALLRLFIDHAQYNSILLRCSTQVPFLLQTLLSTISYLGSLLLISMPLSCISDLHGYEKPVIAVFLEIGCIAILCIVDSVRNRKSSCLSVITRWSAIAFTITWVLFPVVLEQLLALFPRIELDEGILYYSRLSSMTEVDYSIVLYYVTIPAVSVCLIFLMICSIRYVSHPRDVHFLSTGYTNWHLEFVHYTVKLLFFLHIIGTTGMAQLSQATIALAILMSSSVFMTYANGYKFKELLGLNITSKVLTVFTVALVGYESVVYDVHSLTGLACSVVLIALHALFYVLGLLSIRRMPSVRATVNAGNTSGEIIAVVNS